MSNRLDRSFSHEPYNCSWFVPTNQTGQNKQLSCGFGEHNIEMRIVPVFAGISVAIRSGTSTTHRGLSRQDSLWTLPVLRIGLDHPQQSSRHGEGVIVRPDRTIAVDLAVFFIQDNLVCNFVFDSMFPSMQYSAPADQLEPVAQLRFGKRGCPQYFPWDHGVESRLEI